MQITWTSCAEQMPPKTSDRLIFKDNWGYWPMYISDGRAYIVGSRDQYRVEWTPFTAEKWEELTK